MNFAKKISAPFQRAIEAPFQKRRDHSLFLGGVTNGCWSIMKDLIGKYPGAVTWRDEKGRTALHHAAGFGAAQAIEYLLDKGADIEAADKKGLRALHHVAESASKGAGAAITALLERGADIEARNRNGTTPLLYALLRNRAVTAEALVAAGADKKAGNKTGNTPLKEAAIRRHLALALKEGDAKRRRQAHRQAHAQAEILRKTAIAEAIESIGSGLPADITVRKPVRLVK
jgi:uncharacterized protein